MSDFQQARQKFYELRCEKAAESLHENGFNAVVAKDREDAAAKILELIGPEDEVGIPGTVTVRELGLDKALQERGNRTIEHWGADREKMRQLRLEQINSDVLLTGTNAVSLDGKLVNIDGTGNRVGGMIFGPERAIIVAGANKIADDLDAAKKRARRVAGPINAIRLSTESPCAETGYCVDCESSKTICRVTVIMDKKPGGIDATVVLIPEELGY